MRNIFFIILIVCSLGSYAQTKMNSTEAKELQTLVKAKAANTKTIVSDFVQYKHMGFLADDIEIKGDLHFKAPDKIKWAYKEPFAYAVIFKNEKLFVNDEGKKSEVNLGSSKTFEELNKLIIKSVKGDMFDDTKFDITYYKLSGKSQVVFNPKEARIKNLFQSFTIVFNTSGDVEEVKMTEASGDYTKIVFANRTINSSINDAVFNP